MSLPIHCKYDELVSVKKLKPHPKNRNHHPKEQIERLAKIIDYQGIRAPIVVSKLSGHIVKGHGTLMALQKLGIKEIPVVYQDFENSDVEYAFVQSDNAIASWAELDVESIKGDLSSLVPGFDTELLGLKDLGISITDESKEEIEDDVPEVTESISKLGDLYELGEHRLLCGDSTDKATVEKLMNGEKADMVFTDPPYGMTLDTDYSSMTGMKSWHKSKTYKPVAGDNADFKPELIQLMLNIFSYCPEIILWGADYYAELLLDKNKGSWAVWDKRVDESKDTMYGGCFELCWSKARHKRLIFRKTWAGFLGDAEASKRMHPTQKPTEFITKMFNEWAKDIVKIVDLFGGSGSTLIACEKTNRKCFMMELDPHYIDVIVSRWCKYTGKTKIKRNGEEMDWPINT